MILRNYDIFIFKNYEFRYKTIKSKKLMYSTIPNIHYVEYYCKIV
jgi:hypothetical protein